MKLERDKDETFDVIDHGQVSYSYARLSVIALLTTVLFFFFFCWYLLGQDTLVL